MAEINTPIKLERPVVEEAQKRMHAEKAIAHNHIRELNRITFDKIKDIVDKRFKTRKLSSIYYDL